MGNTVPEYSSARPSPLYAALCDLADAREERNTALTREQHTARMTTQELMLDAKRIRDVRLSLLAALAALDAEDAALRDGS